MYQAQHCIQGKRVAGPEVREVINPANETIAGTYTECTPELAESALRAAQEAGKAFSQLSVPERESMILSLQSSILSRKKEIIPLLIAETGKTPQGAEGDLNMLIKCLSFYLEEVKRRRPPCITDSKGGWFNYLSYSPVGVVGAFLTWNFPLLNLGYKLGPILASGCSAVIFPSPITPLATSLIGEIIANSDLPPGTINILLSGNETIFKTVTESRIPRLLTMIGSTHGGLAMMKNSMTSIKRFSLELGGNAPAIVFEDADVQLAAETITKLKFSNAGQVCVSPNRVFVHQNLYEKLIEEAASRAKKYQPLGEGKIEIQPLSSLRSLERVLALVSEAEKSGAKVVTGGNRINRKGFFMEPTILRDARSEMRVCEEEIFGPVMPIIPFQNSATIFEEANRTDAGLSSYIFTRNLDRALAAADHLAYGNILINGAHYSIELPHGGLKQSGYGKDVSYLALDDYFDIKRISIRKGI